MRPLGPLLPSLLLVFGSLAQAQTVEKLLLPIAPQRVPGAFGSEWVTDAVVTNMSDSPIRVTRDLPPVCVALCTPFPIPARSTAFVTDIPRSADVRGTYLFVESGRTHDLSVTLRTRDLSRQNETWGTVIPVVGADDLFAARFGLADVPVEPQFRSTLRIYDVDAETTPAVRVRVYRIDPQRDPANNSVLSDADTLLLDVTPAFNLPAPGTRAIFPASVEIPLWLLPELANAGRVRVQIDPLTGERDYWAFVSVTHNETQHVTVVTPQ